MGDSNRIEWKESKATYARASLELNWVN